MRRQILSSLLVGAAVLVSFELRAQQPAPPNLDAFLRMDDAQLASIAIAEHKARAAVKFRRPTKIFEDVVQKFDFKYILSLDDVVASRGGIPLVEDGKIIGAVGCSGGTGSQDEVVCTAGAALVNK